MKVEIYLEYIDNYNNSFDVSNYYKNYDYVNELKKLSDNMDEIYNKMESFNNGKLDSLKGYKSNDGNSITNSIKSQENALKRPISLCKCDGAIIYMNDNDIINEMAYCASCAAPFRCSIALNFDTSDEDFEDELNNWGYEPKVLKIKFKNNTNSYSYAELKECYLMSIDKNIINIAAKDLKFIKDI